MADDIVKVEIQGLDKLMKALNKFPQQTSKYMGQAGNEAGSRVILPTQGLKKYPPATAANQPPVPYYIRGRGMQYARGNNLSSERLGTQFYVEPKGFITKVGNRASYAKWVVGKEQAHFMGPKGWRKLFDVAQEKIRDINKVYQAWVDKLIRDVGL